MFLLHFDVFCDLLLNRRTATWNLFVLYNDEEKAVLFQNLFALANMKKKPFGVIYCLYKMQKISLVAMRSKEL